MKIFETIGKNQMSMIVGGASWVSNTSSTDVNGLCHTDNRKMTGTKANVDSWDFDGENYNDKIVDCKK